WTQGETLHGLLPAGAEQVSILDARGQRYAQALDELVQTLEQEHRGVTTVEPPLPDLSFEPRNPYKGLRAFTQHDRADFFGRQALVQELLASLKQQIVTPATTDEPRPRLLAIIGPSGSGKSSAAMAGLLPALQEGVLPGSEQWVYLDPLVPGLQPLEALAHLLATRFPQQDPQNIRQILFREGGFGLHQLGMMLMSQPQARLIVTIDQFEELFSSDIPEAERLRFIQLLVTAACEPRGPVLVLLTLRADFYDRPFAYSELGRLIQQQQCPVLPMSLEELREVIERPALLPDVRLTFDEDLVGDLLFDLHGQAAALPLLEFTLEQLFHHRRDRRLTRRAYQEIGGVRGALSRHAEATYAELPSEEHRRLARTMFLRLVQPGIQGQEPLRRRADISEFALEHAEQTHLMRQVIDAFLSARLLTSVQLIETSALEISHEALIREWPRLSNWLQEAREDMQFQQTISHDVREWEQRGKPKDRLYRGSQLKEAKTWQERNTASSIEAAFLRASTTRRTRTRISLMLASLLLLAILLPAGLLFQQQLTPLTVTTLQDDAPGSLRQAIANTRSGGTILIDAHLKGILFLNKELVITRDLTVRGSGINQVVIRGKRDLPGSLMTIQSHATVTLFHLTFSDPTPGLGTIISNYGTLTIEECQLTGNIQKGIPSQYLQGGLSVSGAGGAMRNSGTLILYKSLIARNTVAATTGDGFGGGIFSTGGTLIINDSQIVENTLISSGQHASGGGIFSQQDRLTISNSTISGNSVQGRKEGYGGGIMSLGSNISIDHSQFQGNTVVGQTQAFGGAILSLDLTSSNKVVATGTVSIIDSVLSNNHVTGATQIRGGGIAALSGSVTLSRTSITDNVLLSQQQVAGGAGLFILNGTLTVTDSLVSGNSATAPADQFGALGGGIYTAGTLILQRSTISLNTVNSHQGIAGGGGIYADDRARSPNARLQLANCTIANNQAQGSQGLGGGLSLYLVPIKSSSMDFCTIADNVASTQGGGIYSDPANTPKTALLSLKNSIVASNTAKADPDISGNIITDGYNLVQRWTGAQFNDPHSMHKTDLSVNPSASMGIATQLGMNGGVTPTLALQAGSPAIDAVPASACDVSTDQRGVKRPQHNACDIGAYEYS
ncbi:MAG TPA: choice-of-anchor Q domain-containing protein, partial [Ktedonobacteraceae bacterium]|nr:choice-of-anchor Q domain-containing protein [Ktedonobacteraceae bacterium]